MSVDFEKYLKMGSRGVFPAIMTDLAEKYPNLLMLGADCLGPERGNAFVAKYPDRTVNFGIAEANMLMAAAGMATCGKIPVANTFAVLATLRAGEMIRTGICYPKLNVKIVATGSGLGMGGAGTTHHATEDIAVLRSFANLTILAPCDSVSSAKAIAAAVEYVGPVYIRMGGLDKNIYSPDFKYEIGKANLLKKGDDVTLIGVSTGVHVALDAAKALAENGVSARVLDISTVKPIDSKAILKAAKETKFLVTIEDHTVVGGLGGAVAEVLSEEPGARLHRIGLQDTFSILGTQEELCQFHGICPDKVRDNVLKWLKKH